MTNFTIPEHGEICWRELATNDSEKAQEFYKKLFRWNLEQSKITEMDYKEINLNDRACGGIMQMTKEWGDPLPPSHWMTYIAVDDVDASVKKLKEMGGSVCVEPPPEKIPAIPCPTSLIICCPWLLPRNVPRAPIPAPRAVAASRGGANRPTTAPAPAPHAAP